VKARLNLRGPSRKAKYSLATDSEPVARANDEKNPYKGRYVNLKPHAYKRSEGYATAWYAGIRSLVPKGSRVGPLSDSVALPPVPTTSTYTLKYFRRERAISTFDDTFNPPHRSSPSFSTLVSSDLQKVLPFLHPAHA
jgi:hypothetical protein